MIALRGLLLASLFPLLAACNKDDCATLPPQIEVTLTSSVPWIEIDQLVINARIEGQLPRSLVRTPEQLQQLGDNDARFVIAFSAATVTAATTLRLEIQAFKDGVVIHESPHPGDEILLEPDGCNRVALALGRHGGDGATDLDLSIDDGPADVVDAPMDSLSSDKAADVLPDGIVPDVLPDTDDVVVLGTWKTVASMTQARCYHTATLLNDGTVLVVGGAQTDGTGEALASAERYDPKSDKWSAAGQMSTGHWGHTATLLQDGRVLVVGGCKDLSINLCPAGVVPELYDPTTNSWQTTGPVAPRRSHVAALLQDGKVIVAGGFDTVADLKSLEVYDPTTDKWSGLSGEMSTERNLATATTLNDGTVLLAGGTVGEDARDTLELFDPSTTSLQPLQAKMSVSRYHHTATLLSDGRVLLTGGLCGPISCKNNGADIYDPVSQKITPAAPQGYTYQHRAALMADGHVMIVGGRYDMNDTQIYDRYNDVWVVGDDMPVSAFGHTLTLLADGRLLVTGGTVSSYYGQPDVQLYTP